MREEWFLSGDASPFAPLGERAVFEARIVPGSQAGASRICIALHGSVRMSDIPELTDEQLERAVPARLRNRLMQGRFEAGEDIAALRRFVGLTQADFARAIEISVHTPRNWEQGRCRPDGPAIALLRIAARHPRIIRENLRSAS